jgi:uncharacterized lipoprotein YbaY
MHVRRCLAGSLLAAVVLAACADTSQPTGPAATPEQVRAGQTCTITDDAQARVRTVTAGCTNSEVTLPEGWTLEVVGSDAVTAPRLPGSVGPQLITQIENPGVPYLSASQLIDISGVEDFTTLTSISDPAQTVGFDVTMQKRSVPASWSTWGSPPFTEGAFPHILWTQGAQAVTLTLSQPVSVIGFELGPNPFSLESFTARYFSGGTLVGSITREIHGDGGARLMAVVFHGLTGQMQGEGIDRVEVEGTSDFAIANVRYSQVQPPIPVDVHNVYSCDPPREPGTIHLEDDEVCVEVLDPLSYPPERSGVNPFRSASDVRIGPDFETGTPAESFTLLDINSDGTLDIRLRWDLQQLVDDGHLGPETTLLEIWGRDPVTGDLYRGEAEVTVIGGPGGEPRTLSTAPANNGSGGVFMDLTPTRLVHVVSFDSPFSGTVGTVVDVEVWTRPGTYVGFDGDPTGWTLTQTVQATRAGTTVNAPIELTSPIALQPNTTTAVYLQVVSAGGGLRYTGTAGSPPQTTWSNDDLTLFSDVARVTAVPFAGTRFTPRTFSGNVNYLIFP